MASYKYTPEISRRTVELMKQGYTQEEVCADVGVTSKTFIEWRKVGGPVYIPEFAQAYEKAKDLQKSWWMKKGRENVGEGKDFNYPLFALYVAAMFDMRLANTKDDEVMKELREIKESIGIAK